MGYGQVKSMKSQAPLVVLMQRGLFFFMFYKQIQYLWKIVNIYIYTSWLIIYQSMEYQKEELNYHELLNIIIKNPYASQYDSIISKHQLHELTVSAHENTFYGRFEKLIIQTKKKIAVLGHQSYIYLQEEQQDQILGCLSELTLDSAYILKEGILNIYLNVSQTKKKKENNEQFKQIVNKIVALLGEPLRYYFAFRQYEQKQKIGSKKSRFSSNKSLDNEDCIKQCFSQSGQNEEQIEIIEEKQSKLKICELFSTYLKEEQQLLDNSQETCRICSMKIKLGFLETHVYYCKKKFTISQKLTEIQKRSYEILEEIKQKQKNENTSWPQRKRSYLKLIHKIEQFFRKRRRSLQRNTIKAVDQGRSTIIDLRFQIDDYKHSYQENDNEALDNLCDLIQDSYMLSKKRQILENQYLHHENNHQPTTSSLKSSSENMSQIKVIFCQNQKTRRSIFARKSVSSSSKSNFSRKNIAKNAKNILTQSSRKSKKVQFDLNQSSEEDSQKFMYRSLSFIDHSSEQEENRISLASFEIIKFLGKGAFGRVYLVKKKQTNDFYALKIIKINEDWGQKQLTQIRNQHQIFKKIAGQHLVTAPYSFNEQLSHCFVLQFMPGGDLGKILVQNVFLQQDQAKFYLSEIVLAIEHLHNFSIIHRDLKPENLVIDKNGHLKLTDFGLSEIRIKDKLKKAIENKEEVDQIKLSNTISGSRKLSGKKSYVRLIGTPDYIAPQIINKTSTDNLSIDWWSLGVIAYQLMIGCRPFCAHTIEQVMDNILNFQIEWPAEGQISETAMDLIKKLLDMNYKTRLGAQGAEQIKKHKFFEGINWETIKKQEPPFKEELSEIDSSEEDADLREQIKELITKKHQRRYSNFKLENFTRYDLLADQTMGSATVLALKNDQKKKFLNRIAQKIPARKNNCARRTSIQANIDEGNKNNE